MTLTEEQQGAVAFDLEKARAADEALPYPLDANEIWVSGKGQMHINPPNAPSIFFTLSDLCEFRNLFHGQAAEIERLRADLEQSEEIKRLKDELENYGDHYACLLISKDAQIKELEGMLSIRTEELDIAHSVARSEKEMHEKELAAFARRIKEQDDALVEERARVITSHPLTHVIDEDRTEASMQLQAEGKIGPDAAKPQSWQITEERIGLLEYCLETLLDAPDIEEIPGPGHSIEVLRDMLKEAGQE